VPFVISSGIFIDRRRVEFCPGIVGSGEKDIEVSLKRDAPLEQSETDPYALPIADARIARRANILMYTSGKSLGRITLKLVSCLKN
jgi:hypothetical protein